MENNFTQLFPNRQLTKSQRTQLNIVRHAIDVIAKEGINQVNFTHVAKSAKVTRPLVKHYFKDEQELHLLAARYVRLRFQEWVVEKMEKATDGPSTLRAYIDACLMWPKEFSNDACFWGQFQSLCLTNKAFFKFHQEVAAMGQERIQRVLGKMGVAGSSIGALAIGIQAMITGAIWTIGLDPKADPKLLRDQIMRSLVKTK